MTRGRSKGIHSSSGINILASLHALGNVASVEHCILVSGTICVQYRIYCTLPLDPVYRFLKVVIAGFCRTSMHVARGIIAPGRIINSWLSQTCIQHSPGSKTYPHQNAKIQITIFQERCCIFQDRLLCRPIRMALFVSCTCTGR